MFNSKYEGKIQKFKILYSSKVYAQSDPEELQLLSRKRYYYGKKKKRKIKIIQSLETKNVNLR